MLKSIFSAVVAGGLGTSMAGCSSVTTKNYTTGHCISGTSLASPIVGFSTASFNQPCADSLTARAAISSPDPQAQAVGWTMEQERSKSVKHAVDLVLAGKGAKAPEPKLSDCAVTGVDRKTNRLIVNNCIPAAM